MTTSPDDAGTTLAHLSDPHLPLPAGLQRGIVRGKRLLSLLSWHMKRNRRHRPEILARIVDDLQAQAPDWIAVTGDLTNLGLEEEYRRARGWLDALGAPERVMVIPGNHDALVARAWPVGAAAWRPWWQGDDTGAALDVNEAFPVLRRRGPLALIGMSSAVASPPGFAIGRAGAAQIARLAPMLRAARAAGLCRVVMIHHPPLDGTVRWRKRLIDAAALREVLIAEGVELVLHGHSHRSHFQHLHTRDGSAPVIGAPSASSMHPEAAAWHLYRIAATAGGWQITITARTLGPDGAMIPHVVARHAITRAHAA